MRVFINRSLLFRLPAWVAAFLIGTQIVTPGAVRADVDSLIQGGGLGSSSPRLFGSSNSDAKPKVSVQLAPADAKPGDTVTLSVTIEVPPGNHIYSMSKSFSGRTKIRLLDTPGLATDEGDFEPDHPPKKHFEPAFKQDVEEFYDRVTFSRKLRMAGDTKSEDVRATVSLDYQMCNDKRCLYLKDKYTVTLSMQAGSEPQASPAKPSQASDSPIVKTSPLTKEEAPRIDNKPGPVAAKFSLSPENAKPGDTVTLAITLKIEDGWHTYSITQPPDQAATATVIKAENSNGLVPLDDTFAPSAPPTIKELTVGTQKFKQEVYHGEVTWTRRYRVEPSASTGNFGLSGSIRYQVCTEQQCLLPKKISFALGTVLEQKAIPENKDSPQNNAAPVDAPPAPIPTEEKFDLQESAATGSLGFYLLTAFFGGLILNVMPCVLPVLAIKVLSFVQQAGESRGRILALNGAYAVGVIGVFLTLATLAVVLNKGWGELFQSSEFNLIMACLVFAMGLSLLGVFEIPVPGMVGSAAGTQTQEGLFGAFLTGILATLLATPCSGPLMGATLAWSVRESPVVTYLIWGVMGLGMASPYLIFGMFPKALRWLPKPGHWMVRFKEFSGFVLMGSVIFIIYFLDKTYTIPLLVMLLGIALGLWMIGNLYDVNSHIRHKMLVRITAGVLTLVICGVGYGLAQPIGNSADKLPWEPFSESRLNELRSQNRTVLIDFTADWCLVCKTNEYQALNTPETLELVRKYRIVPLMADYTDASEEIKLWLEKFDSVSVPLTVVFPGARPNQPIIIRDLYSKQTLLKKLSEAAEVRQTQQSDVERATLSTTR